MLWNSKHVMWAFLFLSFLESLDELTSMVVKLFGEVENKNVPVPEFPENPFQEEHLKVSECLIRGFVDVECRYSELIVIGQSFLLMSHNKNFFFFFCCQFMP